MPDVKQAHLQTAKCHHANPSLQKSLLCPPGKKNKKSSPLKKNKTLPTHNPTDRKGMKEIVDNQKGMSLDKKEGQLVTCGIFYCRDSAKMEGCGSLQTSSWLDSDVLRNRQQKHTAVRYGLVLKTNTLYESQWADHPM